MFLVAGTKIESQCLAFFCGWESLRRNEGSGVSGRLAGLRTGKAAGGWRAHPTVEGPIVDVRSESCETRIRFLSAN